MLCVAVITLRVGGAHLHLCFDGSEPPVSLHMSDAGSHHADDHPANEPHAAVADFAHDDQDVGVGGDLVSKKTSSDVDLFILGLVFALLLFFVERRRAAAPASRDPVSLPFRFHLRPPLRGPPLSP